MQVFLGLVAFAAFLGLLTLIPRFGRPFRSAPPGQVGLVIAGSLVGVVAAGALGWVLA